jgi:hypothetical protein
MGSPEGFGGCTDKQHKAEIDKIRIWKNGLGLEMVPG